MTYAAQLIDKARTAIDVTNSGLADHLGLSKQAITEWRHGRGSPMPRERVLELCDIAGITDEAERGYWLHAIERDAVTITSVRRALDAALDRLRPTVAAVGLVVLGSVSALPAKAEPLTESAYVHYAKLKKILRRLLTQLAARSTDGYGPAALLA